MQTHKQMHLRSLNLTLILQTSKGDEWERVCSAQENVRMSKCPRETSLSRPTSIYKSPQRNRAVGLLKLLLRANRTCKCICTNVRCSPHVTLKLSRTITNGKETKSHAQESDWTHRSNRLDTRPASGCCNLTLLSQLTRRATTST
jgi:hypothetical protein